MHAGSQAVNTAAAIHFTPSHFPKERERERESERERQTMFKDAESAGDREREKKQDKEREREIGGNREVCVREGEK